MHSNMRICAQSLLGGIIGAHCVQVLLMEAMEAMETQVTFPSPMTAMTLLCGVAWAIHSELRTCYVHCNAMLPVCTILWLRA